MELGWITDPSIFRDNLSVAEGALMSRKARLTHDGNGSSLQTIEDTEKLDLSQLRGASNIPRMSVFVTKV